jgi:membrane-associated protein
MVATGAALALAAALALGAIETPDVSDTLSRAADSLDAWTYAAVPGLAFLETGAFVGLVVPGETAIVVGGVVAERGEVSLPALIGLVWIAAFAGDLTSFLLGRRFGRPLLDAHGARLRIRREQVEWVERTFDRHGGKAILAGRFVGILRALTPFVAGASRFPLGRFVPYSAVGTLAWAATFTLVGYGFSESFEEAGKDATRIALVAALGAVALLLAPAVLSGRTRRRHAPKPQRGERRERAKRRADQPSGEDVEREVNAKVDARERDGRGEGQGIGPHSRAEDRDRGGGRERGRRMTGRERGVVGKGHDRPEPGIGLGRTVAIEQVLERRHDQGSGQRRAGRREEGHGHAAAPDVAAQAEAHEQRALDPPRGQQHAQGREQWGLEERGQVHHPALELEQLRHHDAADGSTAPSPLLVINGRASGVEDPSRTADELAALLEELGASAEATVTSTEDDLFEALRSAVATRRRVVVVGGDGSLHQAANAPLGRLPELGLVPAGRANNIARALRIPTDRASALTVAARAGARPVDVLRVETPERTLYALEALSAGFQAEARAGYDGENSADLRQGVHALARAVRSFAPYRVRARLDGAELGSASAAQLFLSNLPYFGFGFEVDPGADAADGRLEAILIEAGGRAALLRLLAAAYRGRHIDRPGVRRVSVRRAELTEPLPLVADAMPLGTTTATVTVERDRLRVATPGALR